MKPAKVLLADANAKLAHVIADLLGDEPGYVVVGVLDAEAAVPPAVQRLRPDVILIDPNLTDAGPAAVCAAVRATAPETAVLLWSPGGGRSMEADADGMLERGMTFRELVRSLDDVLRRHQ